VARIQLDQLAHAYGRHPQQPQDYALQRLDHVWEDGGAYALLGPSGCGKTTLLNIISGLLRPSEGRVLFDGKDVTALAPQERNIAQVFQFPVIYDTMTVYDNLAFPLRNRKIPEAVVRRRVHEVADMLELGDALSKPGRGLGADGKQLISMGRGLVREDVAAVLFDEPLTVIDPHLKWRLRGKLKEIHERLRPTMVYVTHDQTEALTFASKVVVMYEGQVVQMGTPRELFEHPAHTFVGYFIGSPGMNLMPTLLDNGSAVIGGHRIALDEKVAEQAAAAIGTLELGIRPEFLRLSREQRPGSVPVRIKAVEDLGGFSLATVALGQFEVKVRLAEGADIPASDAWLWFPPEWTRLYADGHLVGHGGMRHG
jgi:glycerol transport system ATP-binding protein